MKNRFVYLNKTYLVFSNIIKNIKILYRLNVRNIYTYIKKLLKKFS